MGQKEVHGWQKVLAGYPWFGCSECFPLPAYSEFMPAPRLGRLPAGETDPFLFSDDDPSGWKVSELEEEVKLAPGLVHAGEQIMHQVIHLGKGMPAPFIAGHGGENLRDNPYWPSELVEKAGMLAHERYVSFLSLMLSQTQDDKGRVNWTLFGSSTVGPEKAFWKSFYTAPGQEQPAGKSIEFILRLLSVVYGENIDGVEGLIRLGFRILPSGKEQELPEWTRPFLSGDDQTSDSIKYLLTFRPFAFLPAHIKQEYLHGSLMLLPFPGSLVFWGMPNYLRLQQQLPEAMQLPLLHLVARNRGIEGIRVPQSGWFHEPHPNHHHPEINPELVKDTVHRTHRWERVHRHQDELSEKPRLAKVARVLFSTDLDVIGLYDKPMARNSQLWTHDYRLLLDGPRANGFEIMQAEKTVLEGGLFGYRFFYPPMQVGQYEVYWHRPLIAWQPAASNEIRFMTRELTGYFTASHRHPNGSEPGIELWPRMQRRELYLSAIHDFHTPHDHYAHQTAYNILALLDSWMRQEKKPLRRSFAHRLLNLSKHCSLEQWLEDLPVHARTPEAGERMRAELEKIMEGAGGAVLPEPLTYPVTASRSFEENWWNGIRFLAHGEFVNKDNADCILDEATQKVIIHTSRDLEPLGDYLISRHRKAIAEAGMEGKAFCGELPFKWSTDFEYSAFGGWKRNREGIAHERNILVVIPGRNRKEAIVMGDHYDTAYMEDMYEKERGGTGARLSANGADDNYSATVTLLHAAPIFLKMAREGKLERDIWLIHLTGEEFPSDCLGARHFCQAALEKRLLLHLGKEQTMDLSATEIKGVYVMDMIGHNRDNDHDIFQISPGKGTSSLKIAYQAHLANEIWNARTRHWNLIPERRNLQRGKRSADGWQIPSIAHYLALNGEVRTRFNPHSSIFNTDGQIFSDVGIPVVLFMENYDINRSGYHDTKDTMENIDLDYGAALAAIAIESVARAASLSHLDFE